MKQELLKGLSNEQIKKLSACKSQKEVLDLAKQEGIELTDEQLKYVTGGTCEDHFVLVYCPQCNHICASDDKACSHFVCDNCHYEWTTD